jgi:hypothetical protein
MVIEIEFWLSFYFFIMINKVDHVSVKGEFRGVVVCLLMSGARREPKYSKITIHVSFFVVVLLLLCASPAIAAKVSWW